MSAADLVLVGGPRFREREDAVDDRPRIDLSAAADRSDHINRAGMAHRVHRAFEGAGSADFQDVIDARAVGEPEDLLIPFRRRAVIDAGRGAERFRSFQLRVARDHAAQVESRLRIARLVVEILHADAGRFGARAKNLAEGLLNAKRIDEKVAPRLPGSRGHEVPRAYEAEGVPVKDALGNALKQAADLLIVRQPQSRRTRIRIGSAALLPAAALAAWYGERRARRPAAFERPACHKAVRLFI